MCCLLQILGQEGSPYISVCLSTGDEALKGFMELFWWEICALAKKVGWYGKGISIYFGSRGVVVIFFGRGSEAEHDPGQFLFPFVGGTSRHEGCFQAAVKTFNHAVRLRIVSRCCCGGDA